MRTNCKKLPSAEYLRERLDYNPTTGELRWKPTGLKGWDAKYVSALVGSLKNGYLQMGLQGRLLLNHRIIWKMMTGCDPVLDIDHVDGDTTNNRWCNLRQATKSQNMGNQKTRQRDMPKGVSMVSSKKCRRPFAATITAQGKREYIGVFETAEEAHTAYVTRAQQLFGEFARSE